MKKIMTIGIMAVMLFGLVACGGNAATSSSSGAGSASNEETYGTFAWPRSEIAALIPVPESSIGNIEWEAAYGFVINVAETSKEQYVTYVDACFDAGFTVDYQRGDDYFWGDNKDGYKVTVRYYEGNVMFVRMDDPDEPVSSETSFPDSSVPSLNDDDSANSEMITDPSSSLMIDGIRADFKEAIDSYEAFFDEYVVFMKKYKESPNATDMLADYSSYITKYADMMSKIEALQTDDLSTAELAYYADVLGRINQKLADIV